MKSRKNIYAVLIIALAGIFALAITTMHERGEIPVAKSAAFIIGSKGVISSENSTSATLAAQDTFLGGSDNLYRMTQVTVFYNTDKPSASDGIQFQFSTDDTNWTRVIKFDAEQDPAHASGYGGVHTFPVYAQYFRIMYVNALDSQTVFNIQTIYHHEKNMPLTYQAGQSVSSFSDAQFVRSVNNVFDQNAGLVSDQSFSHYAGISDTIGSTPETVWMKDGLFAHPDTAHYIRVAAGGNALDTIGGGGARTLRVVYLDSVWVRTVDTLELRGSLVSDSTSAKGIRLLEYEVIEQGTYGFANVGAITIENVNGEVMGFIQVNIGEGRSAIYSVEAGKIGFVQNLSLNPSANVSADIFVFARENADIVTAPASPVRLITGYADVKGSIQAARDRWIELPEKTDFWIVAQKNTGPGATRITAEFDVLLINQ